MNKKLLMAGLIAALLVTAACSSPSASTTTNKTTPPPAKPTVSPAPAPAPPTTVPGSSGAQTAGAQDFTLVNATGVEINAVHISPHSANDWEEDILEQDTLPDGQHVDIHFKRGERRQCGICVSKTRPATPSSGRTSICSRSLNSPCTMPTTKRQPTSNRVSRHLA